MPNHVHLLLRTATQDGTVSRILHGIQSQYAKYVNWRYQRAGHVFQGRFHASIVEQESYLLEASRYIHRNPVEAGLCHSASQYPWTSFRAYVEPGGDPLHLADVALVLSMSAANPTHQRQTYRDFVEAETVPGTKREMVLGTR